MSTASSCRVLTPPRWPARSSASLDDRRATLDRVAAARSRVERELSFDRRTRTLESIYEELVTVQRGGRTDLLTRAAN